MPKKNKVFRLAMRASILLPFAAFFFSACAPTTQRMAVDPKLAEQEAEIQREIAIELFQKHERRLFSVAYPVLVGGRSFCKDKVAPQVGARVSTIYAYPEEFRKAARKVFGDSEKLRVSLIAPGSPAEKAGLREGDVLLRIDGKPLPTGEKASAELAKLYDEVAQKKTAFTLDVERGEAAIPITLTPEIGCNYPVLLANDDSLNAFADGARIVIMRGMLRFAESDTELATVIAHELAHNVMEHISAKQGNVMLGTLADILAAIGGVNTQGTFGRLGSAAYSQDFEAEADYVGLYIMVLSGLEIEGTAHFWRRMAAAHPQAIQSGGFLATHPSTPERFLALEQTVKEIKAKQAEGKPLRPEMKKNTKVGG